MNRCAVFLFDVGPLQWLPGFHPTFPFALLPFWGDYCLADFMLANVGAGRDGPATFVLDDSSRAGAAVLASRWKKAVARVQLLEGGIAELARLVAAADAESVILAALSSISLVDTDALLERAASTRDRLVKFTIRKTPVELFAARRATVARILEKAAEHVPAGGSLREQLFEGALHGAIDLREDLPGEVLFQNNLMDYYENNMWLASNAGSARFHSAVARIPLLNDRGAESRIGEKGSVDRSWIASGVEVHGTVEDSVIFPNVVVGRNTRVSHCVVLNGNRIGAGAELQCALVFPSTVDSPRPPLSIGDNCTVGARTSTMKNADYPSQIRDGLAVIGADAELPGGFRAEGASYVAPGTPASVLRKLKVLRKGSSVHPSAGGDARVSRRGEAR